MGQPLDQMTTASSGSRPKNYCGKLSCETTMNGEAFLKMYFSATQNTVVVQINREMLIWLPLT